MKNTYVQAIIELIAKGREVEVVLARAKTVMEARGHGRLYGEVLKEVVVALEQQSSSLTPQVVVARASDAVSPQVTKVLAMLDSENMTPVITVDDTIIGGVVATLGHRHIDLSHKSTLQKLYQAITL